MKQFMTPSAQRLELRRADIANEAPFWPSWMRTRWGAWLARRWHPAAELWKTHVAIAQHRELEAREAAAASDAMVALQVWAEADFATPMSPVVRESLIGAWCRWRTHHERKCASAGCSPLGSARWVKAQQRAGVST